MLVASLRAGQDGRKGREGNGLDTAADEQITRLSVCNVLEKGGGILWPLADSARPEALSFEGFMGGMTREGEVQTVTSFSNQEKEELENVWGCPSSR